MTDGPGAEWMPFKPWPAQLDVAQRLQDNRLVVVLKARQLGLTWLCLAFGLWHLTLHPVATVLLFSRRDDEACDLLFRLRQMYSRLPPWLRAEGIATDNDHEFALSTGSRCLAFPTTAGDSYTGTLAIVDEADLIPDLDALMRGVKPTIDGGGRMVLVSRADKRTPESQFKKLYRSAAAGDTEWHGIFLPWSSRPDRTAEWYEKQRRDVEARTGSADDLHEQYPNSDGEALAPKSQDKRLPGPWLSRCYEPRPPVPAGRGMPAIPALAVYQPPAAGARYCLGADPAEGCPTSDFSALEVVSLEGGEQCACLAARLEPSVFAAVVATVARWYNFAPILSERNNHGHSVLLWLRENAADLRRLAADDARPGWLTTTRSKALLYDTAAEALRDGDCRLHSLETFTELSSVEGATLRAPTGQHDDRATAFALALLARARLARLEPAGRVATGPVVLTAPRGDVYGGADVVIPQRPVGATGFGREADWPWLTNGRADLYGK
jgi:hypothetical protein